MRQILGLCLVICLLAPHCFAENESSRCRLDVIDPALQSALVDWQGAVRSKLEQNGRDNSHASGLYLSFAMDYSLLGQAKRLRPFLLLMASEQAGISREDALVLAAAVEKLHTASLILDDLPSADNAELRRGQAALHRHNLFDEGTAILAAIALLMEGLNLEELVGRHSAGRVREVEAYWKDCIGFNGLSQGQWMDLRPDHAKGDVERMIDLKTSKGFESSIIAPFLLAGVSSQEIARLQGFSSELGLLFQIVDDILDIEASPEETGKDQGQDENNHRMSYVQKYGLQAAKQKVTELGSSLRLQAEQLFPNSPLMLKFIEYLEVRSH